MLMEGRALAIAENCKTGEGVQLWRKLAEAYEAQACTRAADLLVKILTVEFDMTEQPRVAEPDQTARMSTSWKIENCNVDQPHRQGRCGTCWWELQGARATKNLSAKMHLGGDCSGVPAGGRDHGVPTPMEFGMVKGQNGKRRHQQPKGGRGCKGQHRQQTCEHWKTWSCEEGLLARQESQPPSGTVKGKSG